MQRTWTWSFPALLCRMKGVKYYKSYLAGLSLNTSSPPDSLQLLDVPQVWSIPLSQTYQAEISFSCWYGCTAPGDIKIILFSVFLFFSLLSFFFFLIALILWCFTWHLGKLIYITTEQHILILQKQTITTQEDRLGKNQTLFTSMAFLQRWKAGVWTKKTVELQNKIQGCTIGRMSVTLQMWTLVCKNMDYLTRLYLTSEKSITGRNKSCLVFFSCWDCAPNLLTAVGHCHSDMFVHSYFTI